MFDEACLGGGAAHVETEKTIFAESSGEPATSQGAGGRAGLDQPDGPASGVICRHNSSIGEHHEHGAAEAFCGKPLLKVIEVRPDDRHRGGVACCSDHSRILANLRRDLS